MDLNIINQLCNMSVEQLWNWIEKQTYLCEELEELKKGKEMIDKLSEFNINKSSNKVIIGLLAYSIYKAKGGK